MRSRYLPYATRPGRLLALRALSNRPLAKLTAISDDPVTAWRREDQQAIRGRLE